MLSLIYRLLLKFKNHEMKAEMLDTFEDSRTDARSRGWRAYASFATREILGLLGLPAPPRSRRWTAIAGWSVAGLLAGYAATYVVPVRYSSDATLRVSPVVISERLVPDDTVETSHLLQTMLPVVLSRTRLTTMMNRFGLYPHFRARAPIEDVVVSVRQSISIEPVGADTIRVRFTYWDSPGKETDRFQAQRVTQDLVAAMIDENARFRFNQVNQTVQYLKERADVVAQQWDKLTAELHATPDGDARRDRLLLDRDLVRGEYESLRRKLSDAQVSQELEERKQRKTLEMIDPASLPVNPDTAPIWIVLSGLVAGFFVGLAVALWRTLRGVSPELSPALNP